MNRNALCACGSGKRYKHCCGRDPAASSQSRYDALAAHKAGLLGRAEFLYRRALAGNPNDVDSIHMLGVVQLQRLRYREALELIWDAAERTEWSLPQVRHNLGLVLGKLMARDANARQADLLADFVALERARSETRTEASPLVTVVLPAYNHARYVGEAIASVAATMRYPRGPLKYKVATARELPRYQPYGVTVELDGSVESTTCTLVAVANTPVLGGGLIISPDSSMTDGLLEFIVTEPLTRREILGIFPKLSDGSHRGDPRIRTVQCTSVTLSQFQGGTTLPVAFADGERVDAGFREIEADPVFPGGLPALELKREKRHQPSAVRGSEKVAQIARRG